MHHVGKRRRDGSESPINGQPATTRPKKLHTIIEASTDESSDHTLSASRHRFVAPISASSSSESTQQSDEGEQVSARAKRAQRRVSLGVSLINTYILYLSP
jgi:hypothetical protein